MKKMTFFAVMLVVAAALTACGAKKQVAQNGYYQQQQQSYQQPQQPTNQPQQQPSSQPHPAGVAPFGNLHAQPCDIHDTPEKFTANGMVRGSANLMDQVYKQALLAAQDIVRNKMSHAYEGLVRDYSARWGNNKGNDMETKVQQAGERIIDVIVNETYETCKLWGDVDSDGHLYCYLSIEIPKKVVAEKIAQEVENKLTQDEKIGIDFREAEFRKDVEERLKAYKEEKNSK